jgi:hypothetical protein
MRQKSPAERLLEAQKAAEAEALKLLKLYDRNFILRALHAEKVADDRSTALVKALYDAKVYPKQNRPF